MIEAALLLCMQHAIIRTIGYWQASKQAGKQPQFSILVDNDFRAVATER